MEKQKAHNALFWVAGVEGLWYTFLVWFFLSGNFIPVFGHGENIAISTTANVVGIFGFLSMNHAVVQLLCTGVKLHDPQWGETFFDWATSLAPIVMLILMEAAMADTYAKTAWWPTIFFWVEVFVIFSVLIDCANLVRERVKKWFA